MSGEVCEQKLAFRCVTYLYVVVGIVASLIALKPALGTSNTGHWTFVLWLCVGTAVQFSYLTYLKLEVRRSSLTYRNISGTRFVEFAQIERAYWGGKGAVLYLRLREGDNVKINLSTFPIRASAVLFTALERNGIPIGVPGTVAAKRWARRTCEEQSKLQTNHVGI